MSARHRFVQRFVPVEGRLGVKESRHIDGKRRAGQSGAAPWIASAGARLALLKGVLGRLLRLCSRVLYLSPLWWLGPLVFDGEAAELAVVGFVLCVVSFFAALNLFVLVSAMHWIRARRQVVRTPFGEGGEDALGLWPANAEVVVGRIRRLLPHDDEARGAVLCDVWCLQDEPPRRIVEVDDFAIVPEDGRPPLVLRFEAAPWVLAPPASQAAADTGLSREGHHALTREQQQVQELTLREGDRVEVTPGKIASVERLDHIELGGSVRRFAPRGGTWDEAPYRAHVGGGHLAISTPQEPLLLRRIPGVVG